MGLLSGVRYDPSTAANVSTASLSAMAVLDATNLTLPSFNAPANGFVIVRITVTCTGATTLPQVLLGVMQHSGGAVIARKVPQVGGSAAIATIHAQKTAIFPVTGLTPAAAQTWDAGFAVQQAVASTTLNWGGPNDTTTNNAWGAACVEAWDTQKLLGCVWYDPAAAASKVGTSLLAMTALDTTNLRCTFTAPASGKILVRCHGGAVTGSTTTGSWHIGILEGATVVGRVSPLMVKDQTNTLASTDNMSLDGSFIVTGVSGGSHSYDLAVGVDVVAGASGAFKWGGPNNASGGNAWGGVGIEVWDAT